MAVKPPLSLAVVVLTSMPLAIGCLGHSRPMAGEERGLSLKASLAADPRCDQPAIVQLQIKNGGGNPVCFSDVASLVWSSSNREKRWGYGQGLGSWALCGDLKSFHCIRPGKTVSLKRQVALTRRGPQRVSVSWVVGEVSGESLACYGSNIELRGSFDADVACDAEEFVPREDGIGDEEGVPSSEP